MVAQEQARKKQNYRRDQELRELELEEREKQANQKLIHSNQEAQKELKAELQNIKAVLNETKEQMARMTCLNKNKNLSQEILGSKQNNENKTPTAVTTSEPKAKEKSRPIMHTNIELAPTPKK
jgi:hypothetical protein